jgi:hypothetical protein
VLRHQIANERDTATLGVAIRFATRVREVKVIPRGTRSSVEVRNRSLTELALPEVLEFHDAAADPRCKWLDGLTRPPVRTRVDRFGTDLFETISDRLRLAQAAI